jgi:hypothetical protein
MRARAQRRALGALFLVLATLFTGITVAAADAGPWPVAVASGALALWMLSLAYKAWL